MVADEAELFAQSLLEASQEYAAGRESWFPDWPSRAQAAGVDVVAGLRSLLCRMQHVIDNGLGDDLAKAIATVPESAPNATPLDIRVCESPPMMIAILVFTSCVSFEAKSPAELIQEVLFRFNLDMTEIANSLLVFKIQRIVI